MVSMTEWKVGKSSISWPIDAVRDEDRVRRAVRVGHRQGVDDAVRGDHAGGNARTQAEQAVEHPGVEQRHAVDPARGAQRRRPEDHQQQRIGVRVVDGGPVRQVDVLRQGQGRRRPRPTGRRTAAGRQRPPARSRAPSAPRRRRPMTTIRTMSSQFMPVCSAEPPQNWRAQKLNIPLTQIP